MLLLLLPRWLFAAAAAHAPRIASRHWATCGADPRAMLLLLLPRWLFAAAAAHGPRIASRHWATCGADPRAMMERAPVSSMTRSRMDRWPSCDTPPAACIAESQRQQGSCRCGQCRCGQRPFSICICFECQLQKYDNTVPRLLTNQQLGCDQPSTDQPLPACLVLCHKSFSKNSRSGRRLMGCAAKPQLTHLHDQCHWRALHSSRAIQGSADQAEG
jgi:hypothetical protein